MARGEKVARGATKVGHRSKADLSRTSHAEGVFTDAELAGFQARDREAYLALRAQWDALLAQGTDLLAKFNSGALEAGDMLQLEICLSLQAKVRPTVTVLAQLTGVRDQTGRTRKAKLLAAATSETDEVQDLIADFNV